MKKKAIIYKKTIQEVIADLIQKFIDTEETENKTESSSCLELAKDLEGCLEDEKDLSTNKNYLNGFGLQLNDKGLAKLEDARKSGTGELPEWLINDMKEKLYVCNDKNIR